MSLAFALGFFVVGPVIFGSLLMLLIEVMCRIEAKKNAAYTGPEISYRDRWKKSA